MRGGRSASARIALRLSPKSVLAVPRGTRRGMRSSADPTGNLFREVLEECEGAIARHEIHKVVGNGVQAPTAAPKLESADADDAQSVRRRGGVCVSLQTVPPALFAALQRREWREYSMDVDRTCSQKANTRAARARRGSACVAEAAALSRARILACHDAARRAGQRRHGARRRDHQRGVPTGGGGGGRGEACVQEGRG